MDGWVYISFSIRLFVDCGLTMGGFSVAVGVWRLYGLCMVAAFLSFCGVYSVSICAMVYLGFGRGVLVFVGFWGFIVGFFCRLIEMYVVESCRLRHKC